MDKQIARHLDYELEYAEENHPNQDMSLREWLVTLRDKADKCIKETDLKEKSYNTTGCSGCGYSGEEERFSVLFACMAIAHRGVQNRMDSYKISRLECFKIKGIRLDKIDEIELKMYELRGLQRELEMEREEDY
jgi:hypothetical protein